MARKIIICGKCMAKALNNFCQSETGTRSDKGSGRPVVGLLKKFFDRNPV